MTLLFTGVTFGLGAYFIFDDLFAFTLGSLVTIMSYVSTYYAKVNVVLNTKVNKKKEDANFKEVMSYLKLKDEREDNNNLSNFEFKDNIIFNDLTFSYDNEKNRLILTVFAKDVVEVEENVDLIVSWLVPSKDCRCPITKQMNDALVKLVDRYDFVIFA